MKPVKTDETNFTYKLPGGTEENDLPCVLDKEAGTVKATWELDDEEARLFVSEAGGMFLQVYSHSTPVRVLHEGVELVLEEAVNDREGILYVVGAAGMTRREIATKRRVDLVMHKIPVPPTAIWVQTWPTNSPSGVTGGEPVPPLRFNLVVEAGGGMAEPDMRVRLDNLVERANELGMTVTDIDPLPDLTNLDPDDLDSPDTKGA